MTARPDRLTIVFADPIRHRPAAASYQTLIEIAPGRDFESIEPIDEKQLADLLPSFNAGLLAERDSYRDNLDSTTRQLEAAHTQVEQLVDQLETSQAKVARLTEELELLRNPTKPSEITPAQLRVWLISNIGPGVLDQIDGLIASIDDPASREIARVKWEYGIAVLRNDPLIVQFGAALGFSVEQMDAAFLQASQL